jgi:hypothetical protein
VLESSSRSRLSFALGVLAAALVAAPRVQAQTQKIAVGGDDKGLMLTVDGKPMMVYGMNWDYVPIGTNYRYSLWVQPDAVIIEALGREMPLLKAMGVNAIRQYAGVPARWVKYIYENWGIYTALNDPMGRYGMDLDGVYYPVTDYSDPKMREAIKAKYLRMVKEFKDTPGVLLWMLGNENNYGLAWKSNQIEALPGDQRDEARAKYLYSLFGEVIAAIHEIDPNHPVSLANGDAGYIDLVKEHCKGLDIFGTNVYRGASAKDLFQKVHDLLGIPVMFTEFGSDAFNARTGKEDDLMQARFEVAQWREIYEQSAGKGKVGNAIGGFQFQWADGWWKYLQDSNLDVHDTNASWPDAAYGDDFVEGANNMNEEWWGICAKGPVDDRGQFKLYPRTAYYALQQAFTLPAYQAATTPELIKQHFEAIDLNALAVHYKADLSLLDLANLGVARVSMLRLKFETYSTGARDTIPSGAPGSGLAPPRGFDHTESFFAGFEAHPTDRISGSLVLSVLGNVAANPIDELYYERRGLTQSVATPPVLVNGTLTPGTFTLTDPERVKVYASSISWDSDYFHLNAFYRVGHFHWQYEGDFFGLYREANYGPAIDIYNSDVPIGFEVAGKRELDGLKVAFGPQIWWGANPTFLAKYRHQFGPLDVTAMFEGDLTNQQNFTPSGGSTTSSVIGEPGTRKATLSVAGNLFGVGYQIGGIWGGSTRVGDPFQQVNSAGTAVLNDKILAGDTFGAKIKLTYGSGRILWYAQSAYMGLVAEGGPTSALTYTGWSLLDSGSGDQINALTGVAINLGVIQIAPNFLIQAPLVGPVPASVGTARNILHDPFVVRGNRQEIAGELLITYDPTPATWMYAWDSDLTEDAFFAASLDFTYRYQPTTQDAGIYVSPTGKLVPFGGAPSPHNLTEVRARVILHPVDSIRLIGHLWGGTAESTGESDRLITRFGADARLAWNSIVLAGVVKINDWGPYDYDRDFNFTYPLQLIGDLSYTVGRARWLGQVQSRIGVRATFRSLDAYSNRFVPNPTDMLQPGQEYEFRTYLELAL